MSHLRSCSPKVKSKGRGSYKQKESLLGKRICQNGIHRPGLSTKFRTRAKTYVIKELNCLFSYLTNSPLINGLVVKYLSYLFSLSICLSGNLVLTTELIT